MTSIILGENKLNFKSTLSLLFSLEILAVLCLLSYQYKNAHPIFTFFDITVFLNLLLIVSTTIIYFQEKKSSTVFLSKETIIFLIMTGWFILSTSWSASHIYKIQKSLCFIFYVVPIWFTGYYIVSKNPERIKRLLQTFALFSLIVTAEVFHTFFIKGMGSIKDIMGANYLITGQTLGIGLIIFMAHSLYRLEIFNRINFWRDILLSALTFYTLINIGGRGPVIAASLCIVGLYLTLSKKSSFQKVLSHFAVFIGITLLIYTLFNLLFQHKGAHFINRVTPLLNSPQADNSLMERLDYYQSAFNAFCQHPFFGLGLGGWPLFRGLGDISYHPHNIFLEIMSETGFVGLLLFLSLIFFSIKGLKLNSILSSFSIGTVCFITLFSFINACKTGDLHDNIVFFFTLSLLAGLKRKSSLNTQSSFISIPTTNKPN